MNKYDNELQISVYGCYYNATSAHGNHTCAGALINQLIARSTRTPEAARRVVTQLRTATPSQSTFVDVYMYVRTDNIRPAYHSINRSKQANST